MYMFMYVYLPVCLFVFIQILQRELWKNGHESTHYTLIRGNKNQIESTHICLFHVVKSFIALLYFFRLKKPANKNMLGARKRHQL